MAPQLAALTTAADRQFGYEFGCDGLLSIADACEFLGGISHDTLNRLINRNVIRRGKIAGRRGNRVGICRRSLREYVRQLEA